MENAAEWRALAKRLETATRRVQAELDVVKAIASKMERLAESGTHGDLPGNGQEDHQG